MQGRSAGGRRHPARRPTRSRVSWLRIDRTSVSSSTASAKVDLDDEHRRAGEVALALGVPADVAGEAVAGQPVAASARRRRRASAQVRQLVVAEAERLERLEQPAGAGDDAVAAAVGQAPGEDLEDAPPVRPRRCAARPAAWSARSGRSAARCSVTGPGSLGWTPCSSRRRVSIAPVEPRAQPRERCGPTLDRRPGSRWCGTTRSTSCPT